MDSARGMRSSGREHQRQSSERSRIRRHGRAVVRASRLTSRKTVGSFPRSRARAELPAPEASILPGPRCLRGFCPRSRFLGEGKSTVSPLQDADLHLLGRASWLFALATGFVQTPPPGSCGDGLPNDKRTKN